MARRFDLTGSKDKIQRRNAQRDTYGNQTPLSSTAVERGETHWMDGSYVRIDGLLDVNGTATVGGTLSVTGTLNASGSINLSGSTGITGPLNVTGTTTIGGNTSITGELVVTGPTTLDGITDIGGDTTISGTLDIQGVTTLNSDLDVVNNGQIKVGTNMKLTPADDGGSILFQDGSKVTSVAGTVQVKSSTPGVGFTAGLNTAGISAGPSGAIISVDDAGDWVVQGTQASIQSSGPDVFLNATKTWINGEVEGSGTARWKAASYFDGAVRYSSAYFYLDALPTTSQPANLYVDPSSKRLFRSTATS